MTIEGFLEDFCIPLTHLYHTFPEVFGCIFYSQMLVYKYSKTSGWMLLPMVDRVSQPLSNVGLPGLDSLVFFIDISGISL